MTTDDIESHMKELYDMDISDSTISRITDKISQSLKSGRNALWRRSMLLFSWMPYIIMCAGGADCKTCRLHSTGD